MTKKITKKATAKKKLRKKKSQTAKAQISKKAQASKASKAAVTAEEAGLNDAQVHNWLLENPDFLLRNESLLTNLSLPDQSGAAISLHQRQLKVLRASEGQLEGKLMSLVENAKNSQSINQRLFELAVLLIEDLQADKPPAFLSERLRSHFDLSSVRIIRPARVGGPDATPDHSSAQHNGEAVFTALMAWLGLADGLDLNSILLSPRCAERNEASWVADVFGDVALQVKSLAVVPVVARNRPGEVAAILVFGANDKHRFQANMAVEALEQLGALVAPLV